jgi:hypothetical protein
MGPNAPKAGALTKLRYAPTAASIAPTLTAVNRPPAQAAPEAAAPARGRRGRGG